MPSVNHTVGNPGGDVDALPELQETRRHVFFVVHIRGALDPPGAEFRATVRRSPGQQGRTLSSQSLLLDMRRGGAVVRVIDGCHLAGGSAGFKKGEGKSNTVRRICRKDRLDFFSCDVPLASMPGCVRCRGQGAKQKGDDLLHASQVSKSVRSVSESVVSLCSGLSFSVPQDRR